MCGSVWECVREWVPCVSVPLSSSAPPLCHSVCINFQTIRRKILQQQTAVESYLPVYTEGLYLVSRKATSWLEPRPLDVHEHKHGPSYTSFVTGQYVYCDVMIRNCPSCCSAERSSRSAL